jgi:hypothetical protein
MNLGAYLPNTMRYEPLRFFFVVDVGSPLLSFDFDLFALFDLGFEDLSFDFCAFCEEDSSGV